METIESIVVRRAGREDLDSLARLLGQLDPPGTPERDPSSAVAAWERIAAVPGYAVHLAEIDGIPVGTYSIMPMPSLAHGGTPGAVVEAVVVDGSCRGRGVGRAMMEHAAREAAEAGCYKLALTSGIPREGAHRFYERLGFRRHGVSFLLPLEPSHA